MLINMKAILEKHNLILMEAAIIEQLRRANRVRLHPDLEHAPLIYDDRGRQELQGLYHAYMSIAVEAELPFIMCTPTWRTNYARVTQSQVNSDINADAVRFMQDIRDTQSSGASVIKLGGLVSCKHDCYRPEQGLSLAEAETFHAWQVDQLAQAGVDFLIAETLPNVEEATGIAKAVEKTATPYIISFVINRNGCVLDGTTLSQAVAEIDTATARPPLGYMINCSYPTFLRAQEQSTHLFTRLIGCQANASSLDHCDLDSSAQLKAEDVAQWGREMLNLNRNYGVKILGGCCGTGAAHLRYLAEAESD